MSARVLIIDPDEDQLTSLKFALQEEGYSVEVARDGIEGFERFKESRPDLVITELMMDRLSGFELSARIAAGDGFQAPVIFYTGFYRDERARKEVVSKYAASGYFVKPFQLQALKRAVAREVGQDSEVKTPTSRTPQAWQESRRRFANTLLGETREGSEPPKLRSEERIEEAPERAAPPNESPASLEQLSSPPADEGNLSGDQAGGQSDNGLAELPTFEVTSPSSQDLSSTQQSEVRSVQEEVTPTIAPQPEPLASKIGTEPITAPTFPVLSKSPQRLPAYRSRPFQILAALVLLGLAFFVFRGPNSFLTKKPPAEPPRQPENVRPASPALSSPVVSGSASLEGSASKPGTDEIPALSPAANPPSIPEESAGASLLQNHPSEGSDATSTNGTALLMSDVTGEGGPPYLLKSKRPILSPEMARAAGTKPLVVRVVINHQGKVIEASPLNQTDDNASLSRAALAAIQNWEFSPVRGKGERTWTRYFSFRFTGVAE